MNSTTTRTFENEIAEVKAGDFYVYRGDYRLIVETPDGEIKHYGIHSEQWTFPGYAEMLEAKRRQGRRNPKINRYTRMALDAKYTRERVFELFREKCQDNTRVALIYHSYQYGKIVMAEKAVSESPVELLPAGDAGVFPAAHPRPTVPAELTDSYDSTAEFQSEVRRLWSLDECLDYPCAITLTHALELLRGMARDGGYDALLPAYEKFVAVCQDNLMLMAADRLLQDYQPGSDVDSTHYGLVRR